MTQVAEKQDVSYFWGKTWLGGVPSYCLALSDCWRNRPGKAHGKGEEERWWQSGGGAVTQHRPAALVFSLWPFETPIISLLVLFLALVALIEWLI